jgi:hypothetical protein
MKEVIKFGILNFISLVFNSFSVTSQPIIQWQKTIGGTLLDELITSQSCFDGGYILGGFSKSSSGFDKTDTCRGGNDYWIIKLDSLGNSEWDRTYGGTNDDDLFSIIQTDDSGFIIGGRTESDSTGDMSIHSHGVSDFWIIKINSSGNIEWQKTYGGNDEEDFKQIIATNDHGFLLGGSSISNASGNKSENRIGAWDYWIIKIDSIGNIQWQNTIGGTDVDELSDIKQTLDNGYLVAGYSISDISGDKTNNSYNHSIDYWIVKLDSSGNIIWQKTIGGSDYDKLTTIVGTSDGGFILAGNSNSGISADKLESTYGLFDFWIIKIDSMGNIIWQNTIGGDQQEYLYKVIDNNVGILVGGYSNSNIYGDKLENSRGGEDFWIVQLSYSGAILWQKTIGGAGDDELRSICFNGTSDYLFCGSSISNISGEKLQNSNGSTDFWILHSNLLNSISDNISRNPVKFYPNPFNKYLYIQSDSQSPIGIEIYSSQGNIVFKQVLYDQIQLNTENYSDGIYLAKIKTDYSPENSLLIKLIKIN